MYARWPQVSALAWKCWPGRNEHFKSMAMASIQRVRKAFDVISSCPLSHIETGMRLQEGSSSNMMCAGCDYRWPGHASSMNQWPF